MSRLSPRNPAMRKIAVGYTVEVNLDVVKEYMAAETYDDPSNEKSVREFVKEFMRSGGESGLDSATQNAIGKSIYD